MVNEYILGYSTKEYLVVRKRGRKNKRMANYICPHCGHAHLIDINNFITAYTNSDGKLVCNKCGKGFKVEIDESTKKRIEKYRERRGRK